MDFGEHVCELQLSQACWLEARFRGSGFGF